ncbi:MAG: hypothetical protein HYT87_08230 [Nitrospirae bacterium]|nr:hypothetical protein [Nitrospirota bacterium]
MGANLIFISCGQRTEEEKKIGARIKEYIDGIEGYEGYFAEKVSSLHGLTESILAKLQECSGCVAVMHSRGIVRQNGESEHFRSSIWINQEIAILAYRTIVDGDEIPILVFSDPQVRIEGIMKYLHLNPKTTERADAMIKEIGTWLKTQSFPVRRLDECHDLQSGGTSRGHDGTRHAVYVKLGVRNRTRKEARFPHAVFEPCEGYAINNSGVDGNGTWNLEPEPGNRCAFKGGANDIVHRDEPLWVARIAVGIKEPDRAMKPLIVKYRIRAQGFDVADGEIQVPQTEIVKFIDERMLRRTG